MNRLLALIFAMVLATLAVSSACIAQPGDWIHFTLQPERSEGGELHATFERNDRGADKNSWSTGFKPSELIGLDVSGFRGSGTRPLSFAIVRKAGRVDCAGNGGNAYASGNCNLTANPAFVQMLVSRGIGKPTPDQLFGLIALNVHRELIDALAAARYPTPKMDDLMGLTALGATGGYIRADGVMVHDMYVMQVKTPAESKYPWDYYKLVATMKGEEAFGPLSDSTCPLVKK